MRLRSFPRPSRKGSYRPRLAALEGRWCPSCTISVIDGHILRILGDETANRIDILQTSDGMTDVSCDGTTASFRGINAFDLATGAGNDFVTANFINPPDGEFDFRIALGVGDDALQATVTQKVDTETPAPTAGDIVFDAHGGAGEDQIQIALGGPDTSPEANLFGSLAVTIDAGAGADEVGIIIDGCKFLGPVDLMCATGFGDDRVNMTSTKSEFDGPLAVGIDTGAGDDRVTATFQQPPEPEFVVRADLGAGNDTFDAVLQQPPEPDRPGEVQPPEPDAPAGLSIEVLGDTGDDQVNVTLFDILSDTAVRVDLGAGDDTFQGTVAIADLGGSVGPAPTQIDPGNFSVNMDVFGRAGRDVLGLQVGGPAPHVLNSDLTVNFDGGDGADTALIDVTNAAVNGAMSLTMNLGAGNDIAALNAYNVAFDADVVTNVNLGGGGDNAMIIYGNVALNADAVTNVNGNDGGDTVGVVVIGGNVAAGASLAVNVDGGGGGDALSIGGIMPCWLPGSRGHIGLAGDGGNDTIDASLVFPDPAGGEVGIIIIGGFGDDQIRADIMPCAVPGGVVDVMIAGDDGNDAITATLRDAHVDGQFDLNVTGGAGADDLFIGGILPCVEPDGGSSIHLAGDGGNDTIRGDLQPDPDGRGLIDIIFQGGLGDDDLTLAISGLGGPDTFQALVDGGDGYDVARVTRGVRVENCEEVFVID
jgi:hypothetical protein